MPKIFTIAASPHRLQQTMSDIRKKFLLSRFPMVLNTNVDADDEFVLQAGLCAKVQIWLCNFF